MTKEQFEKLIDRIDWIIIFQIAIWLAILTK